jgi:hypothetical protein
MPKRDREPVVAHRARMTWAGVLRPGDEFPRSRASPRGGDDSRFGPTGAALFRSVVGAIPLIISTQLKMLTARETTTATVSSDAIAWTDINSFAHAVRGIVSVGLKAVAFVNDV